MDKRLRYIKKVAEAFPYDYEDPPVCKVELWDFSRVNECEEARIEAVTTVASISYGNEYAKNSEKLYRMLIEKGHESPFEFVWDVVDFLFPRLTNLRREDITYTKESTAVRNYKLGIATFKLKVPIFVARQIMRHRTFSYLEMSRRYVTDKKVPFEAWCFDEDALRELVEEYNEALKEGIRVEKARVIFPLALYTQFWMMGDYKAWLNFFIHRLAPETQAETRLVAQAMWKLLKENQPEIIEVGMVRYIDRWVEECNPIFRPARKKKAEWFKRKFLTEEVAQHEGR